MTNKRFCTVLTSMLGVFLLSGCFRGNNTTYDTILVHRDVVPFASAEHGIKSGSTVRITVQNSNEFVRHTANEIKRRFAERNVSVIETGMPDYWLLLDGAFDHYSDTAKTARLNRHVYVQIVKTMQQVVLRTRFVNHYQMTASDGTAVRQNEVQRPQIYYRDSSYSTASMVCHITLYRTKDLDMLTAIGLFRKKTVKQITGPNVFYSDMLGEAIGLATNGLLK